MIIIRKIKTFGRENHRKLREDEKFLPNPVKAEEYGGWEYLIEATPKFGKDKQKLGPIDRKRVDDLKKDIKNGFIYCDGPNEGETEFLDFPGDKSHLMSKKIDGQHRLNYRVYPFEEDFINGIPKYFQKIVYESCWGHETNGGRTYSEKDN